MIKNWKITARLVSPLCGDAPMLDALLKWEMARRLGKKCRVRITRATRLKDFFEIPLPIAKKNIAGYQIYCSSDPVLSVKSASWIEREAKRFDTTKNALILHPKKRKSLLIASGPYKQRFAPIRLSLVERVVWFCRGDRSEINKLLKNVASIGKNRGHGFGLVDFFDYEEMENDFSIIADGVLMRTVPVKVAEELNATSFSQSYGGWREPYWHPETQTEVANPC